MSRTDKDDPYWVRGFYDEYAVAFHDWDCEKRGFGRTRPCDIDDLVGIGCLWVPDGWPWRRYWTPSREDRRKAYYGPERAHVRAVLRAAARGFNANGETDIEPGPRQHRHGVWRGGWWD